MNEKYFDPTETIRGIQQLLVSDKKKIAFLFGAGTSLTKRSSDVPVIPAVAEMTQKVEEAIKIEKVYASAIIEIKEEFSVTGTDFNIESLLTNIEEKTHIIGKGILRRGRR